MSQRRTPDQPKPEKNDQTIVYNAGDSNPKVATEHDPDTVGLAETIDHAGRPPLRSQSKADLLGASRFGRYEIKQELGRGAMGSVYLARDTQLDREVAIKIPQFDAEDGPEDVERFYREARAMATLSHPNLCPVYDVGEIDEVHYLTMQFVEGRPMDDFLQGGKSHGPKRVAAVLRKLAMALEEAHQAGVVHRDLKPANIMLNQRNEPIIMDFGLAQRRNENEATLTHAGQILGTPSYMSPEQVKGRHDEIGPASDVYSLGVICYQLLTGKLPFAGSLGEVMAAILTEQPQPPSEINERVDRSIEAICLKAMAKDIEDRYRSARELAEALRDYMRGKRLPAEGTLSDSVTDDEPTPVAGSVHTTGTEVNLAQDFFTDLVRAESEPVFNSTVKDSAQQSGQFAPAEQQKAAPARPSHVSKWTWAGVGGGILVLVALVVIIVNLGDKGDSGSGGSQVAAPPGDDKSRDGSGAPSVEKNSKPSTDEPPPLAALPFNAVQASAHQEAWANHLRVQVNYVNSIDMEFRLIPPGTFEMGTPTEVAEKLVAEGKADGDVFPNPEWVLREAPPKPARVEQAFYFGVTEVTQAAYEEVTRENSSKFRGANLPVETVSWSEAVAFCNALSKQEGRSTCYQIDADQIKFTGGDGYRLPEHHEWQFACRAGTNSTYFFGDGPEKLPEYAWFKGNSQRVTHPVATKNPNAFGLHDTLGNVGEFYNQLGEYKVSGGGNINDPARYVRCAFTYLLGKAPKDEGLGFRVVLPIASVAETSAGE